VSVIGWLLVLSAAASTGELDGAAIVRAAHEASGGEAWVRPQTLYLSGVSVFFNGAGAVVNDQHEMWRVYPTAKGDAHAADGRVRIRSQRAGAVVFDIAFDGRYTYSNGQRQEEPADSNRWASNFGFGVIRHALDEGYSVARLADDWVDGHPTYTIRVTDPAGGETIFGIDRDNHAIRMVGFQTPRGWHHRVYSEFYRNPGVSWQQPGLVRLYYNGVKQNEVRWISFQVNAAMDAEIFQPTVGATTP